MVLHPVTKRNNQGQALRELAVTGHVVLLHAKVAFTPEWERPENAATPKTAAAWLAGGNNVGLLPASLGLHDPPLGGTDPTLDASNTVSKHRLRDTTATTAKYIGYPRRTKPAHRLRQHQGDSADDAEQGFDPQQSRQPGEGQREKAEQRQRPSHVRDCLRCARSSGVVGRSGFGFRRSQKSAAAGSGTIWRGQPVPLPARGQLIQAQSAVSIITGTTTRGGG